MLLKDAKEVIRIFRSAGFNAQAVIDFIDQHAPEAIREDLRKSWSDDLQNEAQEQLADTDPNWPDSYMERSLEYLRKTCCAAWKGRGR
jgi:phosphoketolase